MPEPLDDGALAAALSALDGWTGDTSGLRRTVTMPTFPIAIEAVHRVAEVAEEMNHHPDIDIRWRTVTFAVSTHSAGGRVTELDVALARRVDEEVGELGGETSST